MTIILIVEDDIALSRLYKLILETEGFQIIQAYNGKEAVDLYKSQLHKPDIILMDHRMPIKNGIEASKEILEIEKKKKYIFLG
jgi:DNA-binding response OmpR family regulator